MHVQIASNNVRYHVLMVATCVCLLSAYFSISFLLMD